MRCGDCVARAPRNMEHFGALCNVQAVLNSHWPPRMQRKCPEGQECTYQVARVESCRAHTSPIKSQNLCITGNAREVANCWQNAQASQQKAPFKCFDTVRMDLHTAK